MPDFSDFVAVTSGQTSLTRGSRETVDQFLAFNANEIREGLTEAVRGICRVGRALIRVKESPSIPHGRYIEWLQANFVQSERTAQRYMSVSRMIDNIEPDIQINAEPTALYLLAGRNTPEEARVIALEQMRDGTFLTQAIVSGIVRDIDESARRTYYVAQASPEVGELALRLQIAPDVIPVLDRLHSTYPDVYEELAESGYVEDVRGNQIPLSEANERDVEDYVTQVRFETYMQDLATRQLDNAEMHGDVLVVTGTSDMLYEADTDLGTIPTIAGIWCQTADDLSRLEAAMVEKGGKALMVLVGFQNPMIKMRGDRRVRASVADSEIPDWLMGMLNNIV